MQRSAEIRAFRSYRFFYSTISLYMAHKKRLKEPEYQEISKKIVFPINGCINKTEAITTLINILSWKGLS